MEIENYHLANITVIIVIGKNHGWMMKLVGKSIIRNRTLQSLKAYSRAKFNNYKRKRITFCWRNLSDTTITKWSKRTPPVTRHGNIVSLTRAQQWFVEFLPKRHNLNLIRRIYQANSHGGTFCKITGQCSSKVSMSWKTKKDCGRNWFRLEVRKHDSWIQCLILD